MKKFLLISFVILIVGGMIIAQSIAVTSPSAGEVVKKGTSLTIKWKKAGNMNHNIKIRLWNSSNSMKIKNLADNIPNNGSYICPSNIFNNVPVGKYVIRIKTIDNRISGVSKVFFIKKSLLTATAVLDKSFLKKNVNGNFHLLKLKPIITSVTPSFHGNYIKFEVKGKYFSNNQGTQNIFMLARRSDRQFPLAVLSWSNNLIVCKTTHMVEWEPWQKFFIYDSGNPPADGSMQNSNIFVYVLKTKIYFLKEIAVNSFPKTVSATRINKIQRLGNNNSLINTQNKYTIYGSMLGTQHPEKKVLVNKTEAPIVSWSNTKVVFRLPQNFNKTIKNFVYLKTYYEIPFIFSNKLLLPKRN